MRGGNMKYEKKIGKFNLIEENICESSCKCGWNIRIGGKDKKDLIKIKKFIKTLK